MSARGRDVKQHRNIHLSGFWDACLARGRLFSLSSLIPPSTRLYLNGSFNFTISWRNWSQQQEHKLKTDTSVVGFEKILHVECSKLTFNHFAVLVYSWPDREWDRNYPVRGGQACNQPTNAMVWATHSLIFSRHLTSNLGKFMGNNLQQLKLIKDYLSDFL